MPIITYPTTTVLPSNPGILSKLI